MSLIDSIHLVCTVYKTIHLVLMEKIIDILLYTIKE